ncbi:cupin domain-containing protein [Lactobacillus delbrueckii]|uniref:cupin domain-containing protein n=1 Tax=Lactobacillus delbrueckii TaxID=1584 RepID=UPI0039C46EBE
MLDLKDYGPDPCALDLKQAALENEKYRETLWTGDHFQVTLMCIPAGGGDIGLEIHHDNDQFIYLVSGTGRVQLGKDKDNLTVDKIVHAGEAVFIPDNTWHNVTNAGDEPMKCFSLYSPVKHAHGTTESTKADAIAQEGPLEGSNE